MSLSLLVCQPVGILATTSSPENISVLDFYDSLRGSVLEPAPSHIFWDRRCGLSVASFRLKNVLRQRSFFDDRNSFSMRLADVLTTTWPETDTLCHQLSPAVIYSDYASGTIHTLNYQGAQRALQQHEEWLKTQLATTFPTMVHDSGSTDSKAGVVIIIAYLSASNSVDFALSILAASTPGPSFPFATLPALLNSRWSVAEMVQALDSSNASERTFLLYESGLKDVAQDVVEKLSHPAFVACIPLFCHQHLQLCPEEAIAMASSRQTDFKHVRDCVSPYLLENDNNNDADPDAVIIFTSGTTGGAKGVRLSVRGLLLQAQAKLNPPCCFSSQTRWLATTVPLFHVGGLNSALAVWMAGGTWIVPQAPSLPANHVTDVTTSSVPLSLGHSLQHQLVPITTLVVVPAMLHSLIEELLSNDHGETEYFGMQLVLIGGQSAPTMLLQQLRRIFPKARFVQTYACTEASSSLTFYIVAEVDHNNTNTQVALDNVLHSKFRNPVSPDTTVVGDCVGSPPPHVKLQLFRHMEEANGNKRLQPIGEPFCQGIIGTRGRHLLNGYWTRGMPQTNRPKTEWFLTNDLGCWDNEGLLYFVGRVKDSIRTGGETVLASEVERILLKHPGISQCAVFPLPDAKYGEAVSVAIVVTDKGKESSATSQRALGLSQIRSWCQQCGLASYKRPRYMFLVNDLPRNSSGKVLKYRLVERFAEATSFINKL